MAIYARNLKIGTVCVDSGQLLIVDPCYIKPMTPEQYEEYYKECCSATYDEDNPEKRYGQVVRTLGICSSTGYGDGEYPVYADIENGRVMKIVINFRE